MNELLEIMEKAKQDFYRCAGYREYELYCSGDNLIAMYQAGVLNPDDKTFDVIVPASDYDKVMDFLNYRDKAPEPIIVEGQQ